MDAENDPYKNQKKPLSHGFSHKSVTASQDILARYRIRMVEEIKEYSTVTEGPVDISCWISNTLLDITAMLTANRDHDGIKSKNRLHPALATLNDTMAFLWGFLQFQRLPDPITWGIRKMIGILLGRFKFFEKNSLSSQLVRDRLKYGSSRADYSKVQYILEPHLANCSSLLSEPEPRTYRRDSS